MVRQILGSESSQESSFDFLATGNRARAKRMSPDQLESVLRKRRSAKYVAAVSQGLDIGGALDAASRLSDIVDTVTAEFADVSFLSALDELQGIVAKCYLGEDYEVHTLNLALDIIDHYRSWQALPAELEPARQLAASGAYAFIEVYQTMLCAVSESGDVSIIRL